MSDFFSAKLARVGSVGMEAEVETELGREDDVLGAKVGQGLEERVGIRKESHCSTEGM